MKKTEEKQHNIFKASLIETKLGAMIAVSDDECLYVLEFSDEQDLEHEVERLKFEMGLDIVSGVTDPISSINSELCSYFDGTLTEFKTTLQFLGTPFQKRVWEELIRTPYGKTQSYAAQAVAIGKPSAYRAVANANGANPLAIVVPCHRIITSQGKLGGYRGGITRKRWLLAFETGSSDF